jgi:hypothetical protein
MAGTTSDGIAWVPWANIATQEYMNHGGEYDLGGGTLYQTYKNLLICPHPSSEYRPSAVVAAAFQDMIFSPHDITRSFAYVEYSNIILVVWCLFITEEFKSTFWVAATIKIATDNIISFFPVFFGIVAASSALLVLRFGTYFWQFRTFYQAVLSVFGWALGSPITQIDKGVDILIDGESRELAIYLIGLTIFVGIFATNVFIAIVMDAFQESRTNFGHRWKGMKPSYFTVVENNANLAKWSGFKTIFPNCRRLSKDLSTVLN